MAGYSKIAKMIFGAPWSCQPPAAASGRPEPVIGLLRLTAELHITVVQPRSAGMRRTAAL